jgi:hypothetical protein
MTNAAISDDVSRPYRSSSSSSLWSICRPDIQRRIHALLNIQLEYFRLRVEFHRQLHHLQLTYASKYEPILEQRQQLIRCSFETNSTSKRKQDE